MRLNNLGEDLKSDGEVLDMVYDWAEAHPWIASDLKEILENQEEQISDGYKSYLLKQKAIEISAKRTEINTSDWTPNLGVKDV